jgi:ABC-type amino acid transport substrate-binding protein
MRDLDRPEAPDPAFVDRLYRVLADELGFPGPRSTDARPVRLSPRAQRKRRSWPLLAVAALLLTLGLGALFVAGSRSDPPTDDLLARMRATGTLRVAVSRGHPQVVAFGGVVAGFDVELVGALASRLGLSPETRPYTPGGGAGGGDDVDLVIPAGMTPAWREAGWSLVEPAYHWPRWLLVRSDGLIAEPSALSGERVGVSAGHDPVALPDGAVPVSVETDQGCLGQLEAGRLAACLTTTLGPSDIAARPAVRVLGEPVVIEPRGPMVRRSSDSVRLEAVLHDALTGMRQDGALADLSRRFLGADLTEPPKDS